MKKSFFLLLFVVLFLLAGCVPRVSDDILIDKSESLAGNYLLLYEQYQELVNSRYDTEDGEDYKFKYESLLDSIWSHEDDFISIYCYLEDEPGSSYTDASNALDRIRKDLLK